MIVLTSTDLLLLSLSTTAATQLDFAAFASDQFVSGGVTQSLLPVKLSGVSNNTTQVTLIGSPAVNTNRLVKEISVYNNDAIDRTVIIELNDNGSTRVLFKASVPTGGNLKYRDQGGWAVYTTNGSSRSTNDTTQLSTSQLAAITGAATPSGSNVFATMADVAPVTGLAYAAVTRLQKLRG